MGIAHLALIIRGGNFQLTMSRDATDDLEGRDRLKSLILFPSRPGRRQDALRDDGTSGILGVLYYHFDDNFSRSPRKFRGVWSVYVKTFDECDKSVHYQNLELKEDVTGPLVFVL